MYVASHAANEDENGVCPMHTMELSRELSSSMRTAPPPSPMPGLGLSLPEVVDKNIGKLLIPVLVSI